jgi:hypothetical protein
MWGSLKNEIREAGWLAMLVLGLSVVCVCLGMGLASLM